MARKKKGKKAGGKKGSKKSYGKGWKGKVASKGRTSRMSAKKPGRRKAKASLPAPPKGKGGKK